MLASVWKIIRDRLDGLYTDGLSDDQTRAQLKQQEKLREQYLIVYDMVNVLVNALQVRFSLLATTSSNTVSDS